MLNGNDMHELSRVMGKLYDVLHRPGGPAPGLPGNNSFQFGGPSGLDGQNGWMNGGLMSDGGLGHFGSHQNGLNGGTGFGSSKLF